MGRLGCWKFTINPTINKHESLVIIAERPRNRAKPTRMVIIQKITQYTDSINSSPIRNLELLPLLKRQRKTTILSRFCMYIGCIRKTQYGPHLVFAKMPHGERYIRRMNRGVVGIWCLRIKAVIMLHVHQEL